MKENKIKVMLWLLVALALTSIVTATPIPKSIDGKIYELDGLTEISRSINLIITNLDTSQQIIGATGKGSPGRYSVVLPWNNGAIIEIKVYDDYHESLRNVTLSGVMHNVDLLFNTTLPPLPPEIVSSPVTNATVDELYQYQVIAEDPNNDILFFSTEIAPPGVIINNESGLITWTPIEEQEGYHTVRINATDMVYSDIQVFVIYVAEANITNENNPPIFVSEPPLKARPYKKYNYKIKVTDPDNNSVSLGLLEGPSRMKLKKSRLEWTPRISDIGIHEVKLVAYDEFNASSEQSFNITVSWKLRSRSVRSSFKVQSIDEDDELLIEDEIITEDISKNNFEFDTEGIPLIKINVDDDVERTIYVSNPIKIDTDIELLDRVVYDYFIVESDVKVTNVNISFKITKDWMNERDIASDEIVLLRFADDKWNDLDTTFVGDENEYLVFEAVSPGFSWFAISHKVGAKAKLPEPESIIIRNSYTIFGDVIQRNKNVEEGSELRFVNNEIVKTTEIQLLPHGLTGYQISIEGESGDEVGIYYKNSKIESIKLLDDEVIRKDINVRKIRGIFGITGFVASDQIYVDVPNIALLFIVLGIFIYIVKRASGRNEE